jgi:hypothetical protein
MIENIHEFYKKRISYQNSHETKSYIDVKINIPVKKIDHNHFVVCYRGYRWNIIRKTEYNFDIIDNDFHHIKRPIAIDHDQQMIIIESSKCRMDEFVRWFKHMSDEEIKIILFQLVFCCFYLNDKKLYADMSFENIEVDIHEHPKKMVYCVCDQKYIMFSPFQIYIKNIISNKSSYHNKYVMLYVSMNEFLQRIYDHEYVFDVDIIQFVESIVPDVYRSFSSKEKISQVVEYTDPKDIILQIPFFNVFIQK